MTGRSLPTLISANGVDLCVQTFGEPSAPAMLLIAGAESSMDWWEDELCELLAAGPRFVIRYDHRDTGQSVTYEPGAPGYDGSDLVADAVGVLDALGIERAHVVGISMGGGIAQHLALEHPDRLLTLALLSASPLGARSGKPALPPPSERLAAHFANPAPEPDWSDRDAVVEHILEGLRAFDGSLPPDEQRRRALLERVVDRSINIASSLTNHWIIDGGDPPQRRLSDLTVPTVVLHGTADPLFPFPHAEALADEIPGARLVPLEGVGHEMPPPAVWDEVVAALLDDTGDRAGASRLR